MACGIKAFVPTADIRAQHHETHAVPPIPNFDPSIAGGRLTIDTDAIVRNWRALRARLKPGSECGAAVKANAYGTGLTETGRALATAGCRTFFVALPAEALQLRAALPEAVIYVLDGLFPGAASLYGEHHLRPVLGSLSELDEWDAYCRTGGDILPAALHIDTGMNRLGLRPDEFDRFCAEPGELLLNEGTLLMSHLACGSEVNHPMNDRQLDAFLQATAPHPGMRRSLANSAGVFLGPGYHFDLARPGIALYGGCATDDPDHLLEPVVKVESRILSIRHVPAGETVGYGAAETTQRNMKVAVVAAGYADGLLRLAGSSDETRGSYAMLEGHRLPLVGRISMDLIALDVTDAPEHLCHRGAFVEMLGPNVPAADLAAHARTIDYEYLTSLGRRFHRRYAPLSDQSAT
ncbi:MAG: alanine racemase [Roseibium sp.]|nr:alanine racemase [Roseibium sp.]